MKIAVSSQNRRQVTGHAGRCRKFWVFQIEAGEVTATNLLELPKEQSFHESSPHAPHPLDDVAVLITGGMGNGMARRLAQRGIVGVVTDEVSPERAVAAYLGGRLHTQGAGHSCGEHGHCGHH